MAAIQLKNENLQGIIGLLDYSPETTRPLSEWAKNGYQAQMMAG